MFNLRKRWCISLFLMILSISTPVYAKDAKINLSKEDLTAFVDGIITDQMMQEPIAGATVSVVHHGELLLERGYGLADVEATEPVSADTLFRIGSITKLFTWISIMQLAEEGAIDLDTDINHYLDFEIPPKYDQPITIRHLMAHTGGFEDAAYGLEAKDIDHLKTNEAWLKQNIPQRIYPPGQVSAYSNYGAALSGYVVEHISGLTFAAYVEKNILEPLGMSHATMDQPVPKHLSPYLSKPYTSTTEGTLENGPFELFHGAPAGSGSASGHDMALFMQAILNGGDGILTQASVEKMHTTLFRLDPQVSGFAHGWIEYDRGDMRIVGHSGDTAFFHSIMVVLPDEELGIFAAYNTASAIEEPGQLIDAILERYVINVVHEEIPHNPSVDLTAYAGSYRLARHNESSAERIMQLGNMITMHVDQEHLVVEGLSGTNRFKAVTASRFQAIDGPEQLAFQLDSTGSPQTAMLSNLPITMEPVPWYATLRFTLIGVGGILILYVATLIATAVDWFQRRRHNLTLPTLSKQVRWPILLLILSTFFLLVGFALPLSNMLTILHGDVPIYRYLIFLPWLIGGLTLWGTSNTIMVWRDRDGVVTNASRVHITFLSAAAIFFIWWMAYWGFFAGMPPT